MPCALLGAARGAAGPTTRPGVPRGTPQDPLYIRRGFLGVVELVEGGVVDVDVRGGGEQPGQLVAEHGEMVEQAAPPRVADGQLAGVVLGAPRARRLVGCEQEVPGDRELGGGMPEEARVQLDAPAGQDG